MYCSERHSLAVSEGQLRQNGTSGGSVLKKNKKALLSSSQIELVSAIWDQIDDHTSLWQTVYIQIFMHKPCLKVSVDVYCDNQFLFLFIT